MTSVIVEATCDGEKVVRRQRKWVYRFISGVHGGSAWGGSSRRRRGPPKPTGSVQALRHVGPRRRRTASTRGLSFTSYARRHHALHHYSCPVACDYIRPEPSHRQRQGTSSPRLHAARRVQLQ